MTNVKTCCVLFSTLLAASTVAAQNPTNTTGAAQAGNRKSVEATADIPASQTANPELVSALAGKLGATPKQAEGAAGSLFSLAKSRLEAAEWDQVANAVPGMSGLLKAAPAPTVGTSGVLGAVPSTNELSGLEGIMGAFNKLGLKPSMVQLAIPVITNYVSKTGGPAVAQLLASTFK